MRQRSDMCHPAITVDVVTFTLRDDLQALLVSTPGSAFQGALDYPRHVHPRG